MAIFQRLKVTAKQARVLDLLAQGKTAKEIAAEMCVSVKTIECHKFNLYRKLGVHTAAQAVAQAGKVVCSSPCDAKKVCPICRFAQNLGLCPEGSKA